ncbi:MAG TPA: hypothetical protein VK728_11275 [Candidatus Sulfotelmatobacter sp.]|nr:hypothetical protein [Candidatus Sulfotelmatobacter sp.]
MKTLRNSILCLGFFLLASPILRAQDFSKYRGFSLGSSTATMLKQTDRKPTDVKVIHARPTLIQELTWWPPAVPGASYHADSVEQMLFSFCNGELYKISVNYDTASTQGLTTADMVVSISAKYGPATLLETPPNSASSERYSDSEKSLASWEDSQYFLKLVSSAFTNHFSLIIFSKKVNAEAELAIANAVTLEKQEKPQRDADLKQKEADDLEAERLKNQKTFRP